MAGQEQHFTSWPENRTRQELEARSIQLILAQCRDPKGAGVAQRKQQTKLITWESGTNWGIHCWNTQLMTQFSDCCCLSPSALNLTQNGPKQGVPTQTHLPAFTPLGSPPAIAPGLSSFQLHQFSAGNVGIPRTRTRPLHRASFHREDGCNLDAKRFLQQR